MDKLIRLGTHYGGWWIDPTGLNKDSIVYSAGVGEDISFDIMLMRLFGMRVHAFDPTPRSIQFIARTNPEGLAFHSYGLAGVDGALEFYPPENTTWVSHSVYTKSSQPSIFLPVKKLTTVMSQLQHTRIDLLKMDIEGCEFEVFDDIFAAKLDIPQICVELHALDATFLKKRTAIEKHYRCAKIDGHNYTYLRIP